MRLFQITAAFLNPKTFDFAGATLSNQLANMKARLQNERDRVEIDLKSEMVQKVIFATCSQLKF